MCLSYHNLKKKMNWGNVHLFLALTLSYVQKLHILWQIFPLEVKFTFSSCSVAILFTISWDLNLCNLNFFLKNQKRLIEMLRFPGAPSWMLELDWLFYLLLYPLITALCSFSPQITFARGYFILLSFQRTNSKIYHWFSFSGKWFSYFSVGRTVVAAHSQLPSPFILPLFAPCMGGTSQSGIWSDFFKKCAMDNRKESRVPLYRA